MNFGGGTSREMSTTRCPTLGGSFIRLSGAVSMDKLIWLMRQRNRPGNNNLETEKEKIVRIR